MLGTLAGFLGAFILALTSTLLLPFCTIESSTRIAGVLSKNTAGSEVDNGWGLRERMLWLLSMTIWGGFGSLLDSALGGWFQASVVDNRTGKIVEGSGGKKVSQFLVWGTSMSNRHRLGTNIGIECGG